MNPRLDFQCIKLLEPPAEIPYALLEQADPSRAQIELYLASGTCYVAELDHKIIGVIVLDKVDASTVEIKNVAVKESEQGNGYGKLLLEFAERKSRATGYNKMIIGTGNSSIRQLAMYQKAGFEMYAIVKDFFVDNYSMPIFEDCIQCKHKIILEKKLNN